MSSAEMERKVVKNVVFCFPNFCEKAPEIFVGHLQNLPNSTLILTYAQILVEIAWLVFHLC